MTVFPEHHKQEEKLPAAAAAFSAALAPLEEC